MNYEDLIKQDLYLKKEIQLVCYNYTVTVYTRQNLCRKAIEYLRKLNHDDQTNGSGNTFHYFSLVSISLHLSFSPSLSLFHVLSILPLLFLGRKLCVYDRDITLLSRDNILAHVIQNRPSNFLSSSGC